MKHLPKEKKQHLLLVVIGTLIILLGLWFGLISWQQGQLARLALERDGTRIELNKMKDTIESASSIAEEALAERSRLEHAEEQMASGDHYAWVINTVRGFKARHPNVEIPQYSTILLDDTTVLPKFPYRQATLTVAGKAYYHDLGRFLADFENEFPYVRIQNLELEPAPALTGGANQKLAFRMDIVTLVKPEA